MTPLPADTDAGGSALAHTQGGIPRISLSMIVRNEERFLPGCLESVRGLVDEVVIVDTGSTDATVEIAGHSGARLYNAPWTGDFSVARNVSLGRCTGDWVLYLDADERVLPGQAGQVRSLMEHPSAAAFHLMVRSTLSLQDGKSTQVMPYPRLFRRAPGVRFEGSVHEQIAPSILRSGGKIFSSSVTIEHLGYDQGFEALLEKIRRNLGPLLDRVGRDPLDWHAHLHIARSLLLIHDYPAVVHHARAALLAAGLPRPLAAALHNLLAEVMVRTSRWDEAIDHAAASLALVPRQTGARWFLAGARVNSGNVRAAISVLEELAADQEGNEPWEFFADDIILPAEDVWDLLGRCYAEAGFKEKAVEALFNAVRANPRAAETAGRFWKMHEELGQPLAAIRHCEELVALMPGNPRPVLYMALSRMRQGNPSGAMVHLNEVLAIDPANPPALSWKALWSLEQKDLDGAESAVKEAELRGVKTNELCRCAFEVAMQRGQYTRALRSLESMAHQFPQDRYTVLHEKVSALAARTG